MKTDNITIKLSKLNEIIETEINKIITLIKNNNLLEVNNYKFNINEIEKYKNYIDKEENKEQENNKKKRPMTT